MQRTVFVIEDALDLQQPLLTGRRRIGRFGR
jgi:hypothetical protein